jgi:hypothetical protein
VTSRARPLPPSLPQSAKQGAGEATGGAGRAPGGNGAPRARKPVQSPGRALQRDARARARADRGAGGAAPPLVVVRTTSSAQRGKPRGREYLPPVFRDARQPKYIDHCAAGDWHLHLENTRTGEDLRIPYRCNTWRHHGTECQRARSRQDFARVRVGMGRLTPGHVVAIVLTLPRPDTGGAGLET